MRGKILLLWLLLVACLLPSAQAQLTVSIDANGAATPVPRGFAGCSVEMSSVGTWAGSYVPGSPSLFDQALVNLLNLLGQYEGPPVIRIGGNSQDRSWLQVYDNAVIPPFAYTAPPTPNAFTPTEANGLAWVQRLSGCPMTLGLNMGGELPSEAVEELAAFRGLFDPAGILAFDVGNEPDESDFTSYRSAGWSEAQYTSDLVNFLTVLQTAAPTATFAAPAVGGTNWLPSHATSAFNSLLSATSGRLAFITAHRYIANGASPPSDPTGLLFEAANSSAIAANYSATLSSLATHGDLPLRMNETNTFYNGGLAGVSNAMASALWVADVLGSYAEAGIVGVNFHGGSSGPYTPFTMTASSSGITVAAEPVYYGMMLFAQFIQNGAGLIPITASGSSPSTASFYASRDSAGALRVLIINKSETSALTATLNFTHVGAYQPQGNLLLLLAPSLSATLGLTLAGQSYDANGNVQGAAAPISVAAQPAGSGSFSFSVPLGSAALFVLDLETPSAPTASAAVSSSSVNPGAPVVFTASAGGTAPFSYQWTFDGGPISGATGRIYAIPAAQSANAGSYGVVVTNPAGAVQSAPVSLAVSALGPRLVNLSSRAQLANNANPLTAGFVIGGTQSRTVLIRAAGPALSPFGISNPLPHPTLTLFSKDIFTLGANTGWSTASNAAAISAAEATTGAFPFPSGSADSAMLVTLAPGSYSAQVTDATGASGVALVEVYQADTGFGTGRLVNVSTRALVGTGINVLASGFVVSGPGSKQVLIRGVGPALASYGITGVLAAPVLQVYGPGGTLVSTNTGWDAGGQGPAVAAAEAATGAFALPAGSADTAMVLTLQPGNYTAQVSGANSTTGNAMVEIYELD